MRPMTFINGVIFGSSAALGVVLVIIIFFRWVLTQDATLDQNVVLSSLPLADLLRYMLIFLALAGLAGVAFFGELLRKPWRGTLDYLLTAAVVGVVIFFFAEPATRLADLACLAALTLVGAALLAALGRMGLLKRISDWLGE
jgi:hypothetical protein